MKLNSLKLSQFKNYQEVKISFSEGINCILGKNGMGKTNLLDAIHYLSMTRSALNSIDQQNISHGEKYFAINSEFTLQGKQVGINCYFEQGKKKVFKVDGKEMEKLSDHIGNVPSVLILPDDTEIIKEGSEVRRKFFDSVISQHDRTYLELLMNMQRLLKQRNSFLKSNDGNLKINYNLINVYDEALLPIFRSIVDKRTAFIEHFAPFFSENYALIFEGEEVPNIIYKSEVTEDHFEESYQKGLQKDIVLQRTNKGAHKDDYAFKLNDRPIKKFGSQGQQKSFIIALKLAEYDYLKAQKGFEPLLLLDDIFDKLDDDRIERLITLLTDSGRFSQIFMTDARAERSRAFFKAHDDRISFYDIANGAIQ
ncbi:MAG: DNA replication and repair protein RecF [Marinoscillum sp.]|uniref:DNA replication/repair protein RecF n=1 Tax=Marinoscillum sp. TaxID=2024838 RepID=UPI0032FA43D3